MKRFLALCLILSSMFTVTACFGQDSGESIDKRTYITSPLPADVLEENSILRRPDAAADVNDYAAVTETAPPAETKAPETVQIAPSTEIDIPTIPQETRLSFVAEKILS